MRTSKTFFPGYAKKGLFALTLIIWTLMAAACENPWISSLLPERQGGQTVTGGQTFTVTVETYCHAGSSSTANARATGVTAGEEIRAVPGTTVTITAAPYTGYRFIQWYVVNGDIILSDPYAMEAEFEKQPENVTIRAYFEAQPPATPALTLYPPTIDFGAAHTRPAAETVTITNTGTGTATVTAISLDGADYASFGLNSHDTISSIEPGATATFTVRPAENIAIGTHNAVITVTYDDGETATANVAFELLPTFTVTMLTQGNGTTSADQPGIPQGQNVTITATSDANHHFVRWEVAEGDVTLSTTTETPATFTMPDSNVTIRAIFEANPGDVDLTFQFNPVTAGAYLTLPPSFEINLSDPASGFDLALIGGPFESIVWHFRGGEYNDPDMMTFKLRPSDFTNTDIGINTISVVAVRSENGTLVPYGTTIRFTVR